MSQAKSTRPHLQRHSFNFVAHGPSAESTVNKNNTIFPITEQLVFIITLFDRSVNLRLTANWSQYTWRLTRELANRIQ